MIALNIVISGSVLTPSPSRKDTVQDEVRQRGALDRLGGLGVGGVNQGPHLAANVLLPPGKGIDVVIDPRIHRKVGAHHGTAMTARTKGSRCSF
jgi:hypothetical protein